MTYAAAPTMTYLQPQPMQYVNEHGQPCTADRQLLQVQQPMQYVNEHGQPCSADGQLLPAGASMQVAQPIYGAPFQPTALNISPEIFAKLAQGGALTPEELAGIQGGAGQGQNPPPVTSMPSAMAPAAASSPAEPAATSPGKKSEKKSSKKSKKALSSKKKKSKGCC